jgi:Flp pilus assembly protein TadD
MIRGLADPRNATLWLGKGLLLNNIGNVEEAARHLITPAKSILRTKWPGR